MNTTVTSVKTITPLCSTRKFPGPAGLLSENVISFVFAILIFQLPNVTLLWTYFQEDLLYSEDPSHLESLDISINIAETDKADEVTFMFPMLIILRVYVYALNGKPI